MKARLAAIALAATGATVAATTPALADTFVGTTGDDRIVGTPQSDIIRGLAGADTVLGRSGNDAIRGNPGRDEIHGAAGHDFLLGDRGNDSVLGGNLSDDIAGGDGQDILIGGRGADYVLDYPAGEFFDSPNDPDRLFGRAGADNLAPLDGADKVWAGTGPDAIRLQRDGFRDVLRCGAGQDRVIYFSPRDRRDTLLSCERVVIR